MYKYILILAAVAIVILGTIGFMFFFKPTSVPTNTQTTTPPITYTTGSGTTETTAPDSQSVTAVQAAYRSELLKHPSDNTKLGQTVISGGYALQVYAGDILGGEALLKYDQTQGKWLLVDGGGGEWSVDELIIKGVPRANATALLSGISQ